MVTVELWGGPKDGQVLALKEDDARQVIEFMVTDFDPNLIGTKLEEGAPVEEFEYRSRITYIRTRWVKGEVIRYDYRS